MTNLGKILTNLNIFSSKDTSLVKW